MIGGKWFSVSGVLCTVSTALHATAWVACANSGGFLTLCEVDFQPVMCEVHYLSSLLVVLVPQCALKKALSRLFSVSVVSLVFCKTSLISSRCHFIPISFLPYGPSVREVMVWFQCQMLGWAWVQPPFLALPYLPSLCWTHPGPWATAVARCPGPAECVSVFFKDSSLDLFHAVMGGRMRMAQTPSRRHSFPLAVLCREGSGDSRKASSHGNSLPVVCRMRWGHFVNDFKFFKW